MKLKGVHFILTYKCDLECDHCFVWGSPKAKEVFTLEKVRNVLAEAKKLGTVNYVAIEGGEPFLYYPIMVATVKEAATLGFHVEVLSNCYWAASSEDARVWLLQVAEAGDVELSLSSDLYHGEDWVVEGVKNAVTAANAMKMKVGVIAVKNPNAGVPCLSEIGGAKVDFWELMYRGRAVSKLAEKAIKKHWREFTKCPYEDFTNQQRVHVDPLGYVHVCQGISIGNAWQKPLSTIIEEYNPYKNPILEPLIRGGPSALAEKFNLSHDEGYADACHLCYTARCLLKCKFPDVLVPDQMYGDLNEPCL